MPPGGSAPASQMPGVADRGADLEHAPGPDREGQHAQQGADLGVDERQAPARPLGGDVGQHRVRLPVELREVRARSDPERCCP